MASSSESLSVLKELFPDWSTEDLTSCLEESRGELDTAITRISEGHATKFGEVTKKKEKAPKRVEYGNGRGRGRGASTGAPRGRSDFRGRGRGRGASTSAAPSDRTAVETTPSWAETETTSNSTLPTWATEDAATSTKAAPAEPSQVIESKTEEPVSQAPTTGLFSAPPKAKARIVDKNSTSSWASVARPVAPAQPASAAVKRPQQSNATAVPKPSIDDKTAPLTEQNLEAVTEDQPDLPQPPTATVASLQGEPATGPPSVTSASQVGPPGLKAGQQTSAGRVGTPIGGRRLNQNEAVVMPGSEREPAARLGVQFGSLGLGDEEVYNEKNSAIGAQKLESPESRTEANTQQPRQERSNEGYGSHLPQNGLGQQQQQHQQQPQPHQYQQHQNQQPQQAYGVQSQDQYSSMSSFYGQNEQARASPFGGHNDYYGQHSNQHTGQPPYGLQSAASQRSDTTSRPTDPSSRFGEPAGSPITSITSQPPHSTSSPVPSHHGGQQQQHPSQFPMHPQYGAPNPYAYYGYGYGYPQQHQHSGYGGQMYAQQQQRGGYGAQAQQYQGAPVSHQPVGTSQDRFERSTAEYQRQQQQSQYSQSGFGNTDFLGSGRNPQAASESLDPFKGYNSNQGSSVGREDTKTAPTGFGAQGSFGQQTPSASQYGSHTSGQYGEQQQQQQQQPQQQSQFSQYGSYGRQSAHQQYGGQWNQY